MIEETAIRAALQELATALRDEDLEGARAIVERVAGEAGVSLERDRPQAAAAPAAASGTTSPERDVRRWLRTYTKFFTEWKLEDAKLVAQEPPPDVPARLARAPGLMLSGADAALSGRHADAREMLDLLLRGRDDAITPRHLIGASRRAQLFVYLSRTCMHDGDLERATSCLAAAERLGPDDPVVHAALGQLHDHVGEPSAAAQAFQHALAVGPDCPDGYIGMGKLSEDAERHDEAADWFERAIDMLDGRADRAGRLLGPVPAGLLLASARRIEQSEPRAALERYDAALLALRADQVSLRARIQQARAPLLEEEDPRVAAEACFEAATLVDLDRERRRDLLERAAELAPTYSEALWELADGLRTDALGIDDRDDERELLEHAAAVWDEGRDSSAPGPATSWVYTSRALISDRLARLDRGSAREELWAAAALLEQAILTDPDEHYRWLHLSRILRGLNLRVGALEASAAALALAEADPAVLTERCDALVDAGMPDDAAALIEPLLEAEPTVWITLSAGWALCESGRHRDALEHVDRALERADDPDLQLARPTLLGLRARCLRRAGEHEEERATLSELAAITDGDAEGLNDHVWALYTLSRGGRERAPLDEVLELLEEVDMDDPFDRWAPINASMVRLATGDTGGAEGIRRGLGRLRVESELRELSNDVAELRPGAGAEMGPVLDELIADIDRCAAAARTPTAQEELDERDGEPGARLAIRLARARLRRAADDWPGALEVARTLPGDADARRLLAERVLTEATTAARDLLREGEADTPGEHLEAALEAAAEASLPFAAAGSEALLALALLRLGDDGGARAAAERAVSGLTLPGGGDPLELFWQECGPVATGADELWALDELVPAPEVDEEWATGRQFYAARYLPSLWAWWAGPEPAHDPRPAVRLGDALIPEDTGPSWLLFSTLMPALRDRVRDETGIIVPGALFLDGPNLTPAEFEISIAGLAAERSAVPAQGIDPMVFVVDRLEAALRHRLEQFVTLDDAMELLAGAPDGGGALPTDRAGKLRVAAIMRALATDRVPLTRLEVVRRAAERSDSATAAAEAIRLELVAELPGSDAERLLELPEGLSKRIDEVFDLDAGTLQAAATPPAACRIEEEVARWVAAAGTGSLALVARDERERRIVQLLTRRHGLDTPVLRREEVAAAGRSAEAGKELHA